MGSALETVTLRITLRYRDLDEFMVRHAEHVSSAGLFIRSRSPKSPGTQVRFELRLSDGTPALIGTGAVVSVREDGDPGMALRFNDLDADSRRTIEQMVQDHGDGSLAPTPLALKVGGIYASSDLTNSLGGTDAARSKDSFADLSSPLWPVPEAVNASTGSIPALRLSEAADVSTANGEPHFDVDEDEDHATHPTAEAVLERPTADLGNLGTSNGKGDSPPTSELSPAGPSADAQVDPDVDATVSTPSQEKAPPESSVKWNGPGRDEPGIRPTEARLTWPTPGEADALPSDIDTDDMSGVTSEPEPAPPTPFGSGSTRSAEPPTDPGSVTKAPATVRPTSSPDIDIDIELEDAVAFPDPDAEPKVPAVRTRAPATEDVGQAPADSSDEPPDEAYVAPLEPSVAQVVFPNPTEEPISDPDQARTEIAPMPAARNLQDVGDTSDDLYSKTFIDVPSIPVGGPEPENGSSVVAVDARVADVPNSADLPPGVIRAVAVEWGIREVRMGTLDRSELRVLASGGAFPALTTIHPGGEIEVGEGARERAEREPGSAISPMEILCGVEDGRLPEGRFPVSGWGKRGGLVQIGDERAEMYDLLVAFASAVAAYLESKLSPEAYHVFLSVPPHLEDGPAGLVRAACKEAGLDVHQIADTSAVLAAAFNLDERLVDAAITINVDETQSEVVLLRRGPRGLRPVGRRSFEDVSARIVDDEVAALAITTLLEEEHRDFRNDQVVLLRLRDACARARADIRRTPTVELRTHLPSADGDGASEAIRLARTRVYGATEHVTGRLHEHLVALLRNAGVDPRSVGEVVLAGEGSSFPPFQQVVSHLFGRNPLLAQPATHALIQGLARLGRSAEQRLVAERPDTLDASIGVALPGGRFKVLVPAGTRLPTRLKRSQPLRESQTDFEIRLLQGDGEMVKSCVPLGGLQLRGLPAGAKGTVKVDLDLRIDARGVLSASIRETESGHEAEAVFATAQVAEDVRASIPPAPGITGPVESAARPAREKSILSRLFGKK
ncbi:MAG: TIGR02266 family protein [Myxococcota bacterium]